MSNKKADELLVWADCEFTGLDIDKEELIEAGIIVTDYDLNKLDDGINLIIKPSQGAIDNMGDFVKEMHTKSGLLKKLETGLPLAQAQEQALSYVKKHVKKEKKALLAGNSIWSDRKFLDKYMPDFTNYLHYRMIDVSTIKMLVKQWFPVAYNLQPKKQGSHRAIDDINESIEELKYYRENVFSYTHK